MKKTKRKALSFPEDKNTPFQDLVDEIINDPIPPPKGKEGKQNGSGKEVRKRKRKPTKKSKKDTILRSFYVSPEMVRDLKDIVYHKERSGHEPYTQKDALREALALLKKTHEKEKRHLT